VLAVTCFTLPAQTAEEELPDMALLEYLAELVEVDGELVGPMDMANNDKEPTQTDEQTNEQPKQPTKPKKEDEQHD
jgi:outer membrane biosynthesis protein TonB